MKLMLAAILFLFVAPAANAQVLELTTWPVIPAVAQETGQLPSQDPTPAAQPVAESGEVLAEAVPTVVQSANTAPVSRSTLNDLGGSPTTASAPASPVQVPPELAPVLNPAPVQRPDPPVNPYENLPPGAIPPSRPTVPENPYRNLPVGVTVPRPSVPCGGAHACSPG